MGKFIDLTGVKFGRLSVLGLTERGKNKAIRWLCLCDCGKEKTVDTGRLKSGQTKSCGCYQKEMASKANKTHGHKVGGVVSPEYTTWQNMKCRCYDTKDKYYELYGGRGITVCDRWLESFENFYEDMGDKPSNQHSIDRIEVDGNYEPANCKWATKSIQAINQRVRHDNTSGHKGVSWHKQKKKWVVWISIDKMRINLGHFTEISKAVSARQRAEIKYHLKLPS